MRALKRYEADTCEVECEGEEPNETNWPHGVRTGERSSADFDYTARLTEIMLVGNVANRVRRS